MVNPPVDTPIWFLAGEFGCTPKWYAGFVWQSSAPGQEMQFFVDPRYFGYPENNPPFHAPPYLGQWKPAGKAEKDGE
jgi:hypothetical protein